MAHLLALPPTLAPFKSTSEAAGEEERKLKKKTRSKKHKFYH